VHNPEGGLDTVDEQGQRQVAGSGARGHGWWPYLLPYLGFMAVIEVGRRLPEEWAPLLLVLKPGVPGALMVYFWLGGAYPELRAIRSGVGALALDVMVGLLLAVLWMAPYIALPWLRPEAGDAFDPEQLGESMVSVVLALRMLGYGLVTPFFEELFIRNFAMRYSEVFRSRGDFRDIPLAHFGWTSFIATTVIFTLGHLPWEYWVAVPWVVLTNLWFYYRKDLYAVILVHATTNASMLVFVAWASGWLFQGENGGGLSLWFFV
jgi:CAAX prenyl protease-like protein